tara:strand:- start:1049 stop:1669 length:621 start_codon:yes stop_codon:yes gene_type:complete
MISKLNKSTLKELTKDKLKFYWNENSEALRYRFSRNCYMWMQGFEFDKQSQQYLVDEYSQLVVTKKSPSGTSKLRQFGRLVFGYNGLGFKISPAVTGLMSERSLHVPSGKCTDDHILGVTPVGWKIHTMLRDAYDKSYKDYGEADILKLSTYLADNWLEDNLHYWVEAKITREEHRKDNLARDRHTLEQKENLVHYDEGSIHLLQM